MKNQPEILFKDDFLVVVNKPPGYLSIPDRYKPDLPNVLNFLRDQHPEVFTVHRLDRETSGVICFALNAEVHRSLSLMFENRIVRKRYWALVEGLPMSEEGVIDRPLSPHPSIPGKMVISKKGKASVTKYRVLERFRHYCLLEVEIETGRQHQIRVHLQAYGHPLIVDSVYGRQAGFYLSSIKRKYRSRRDEEERPLLSRTALHAYHLGFDHPGTGEKLEFEAPLPKDLKAVLNQLRKWTATT